MASSETPDNPAPSTSPEAPTAADRGSTAAALEAARREKLAKLGELGVDPWGHRFDNVQSMAELREQAEGMDPADQEGPTVRVAGRILLLRNAGRLVFLTLADRSGRIQVMLGKKQVGPEVWPVVGCLDLGDIVGVDGRLGYSNSGEITVFASSLTFLAKSIETPPDKYHGLVDAELRQRMRYLDLIHGDGVLERFTARIRIIEAVRRTLTDRRYLEVEGPTLHTIAGGAAARPFATHHNALDMPIVMRIALELHLKRLLVGGMERVFELGRVYRNEGISTRHNPEFTMLEAYEAYGNYETMMDLTEAIILNAAEAAGTPTQHAWMGKEIDLSAPFRRARYDDLLAEVTGCDPADPASVAAAAAKREIETAGRHPDVIKSELFEATVEEKLINPTFVIDYPAGVCPLTKRKRDNPAIAERFELYVCGMELANAYTELNDPDLQEELFRTQLAGLDDDESMARMDHDFIKALRHGMPPAGGLGIGIDRLVMLLTGASSIRDVILFPIQRPQAE
ncbi:MAG: lysine--tRNA ligase [Pirellulales bacterium]|jgi:lysyl-tRNA synthetase, class II|nr:lysine--tRNA ligase [Pirellulales bacterium]MBL7192612.1 lysine--tRNA ligase [Pirellulales bacterium]